MAVPAIPERWTFRTASRDRGHHALQGAGEPELHEQAIDAVRLLVHVLEEEQRGLAARAQRPGRARGRGQERQAASAENAFYRSRTQRYEVVGLRCVGAALPGDGPQEARAVVGAAGQ